MSLWYNSRAPSRSPVPVVVPEPQLPAHPFRAWTESLLVTGVVRGNERLSDIFNRREPLDVEQVTAVPHGSSQSAMVFPQRAVFDPFDFDVVIGGALDDRNSAERRARRIYKVQYPVLVEGHGFEVRGLVHLFPGNAPEFAMHHTGVLFLPISRPVVRRGRSMASDPGTDVALVNRFAITGIRQIDGLN